jgi:hypothetical protein
MNSGDARIIEKGPRLRLEHVPKETSEKSGETACPGKTRKQVVGDMTLFKTFFEVFSKVRQGNRNER